jgi:phage terminase large subunit-like protein
MALSNTATPIYYGEFREKVRRGEIPVNEEVSMQMNRIDARIEDPSFYYDDKAINGFIAYCEAELCKTDGSDLDLLDTFKLWAEDLLSWFYFEERPVYSPKLKEWRVKRIKRRLTRKQYLIVARGAAKSMYAFCIQAYFLNVDPTTTTQITTAPTMKQAEEVMIPFRTSITRARGILFKFLTEGSLQNTTGSSVNRQKLASTKKGIENFITGSTLEIRPMSVDKLQGARPKVSTVDEWLSGDTREDVVAALEQGASKLEEYFIVAISSEGTVRNGTGDTIKMELSTILRGEAVMHHISIWHYKLDDVSEVPNHTMWVKANPNIDYMPGMYETYHLDVQRIEIAPSQRNDILAKRFGIPMEGFTYFFAFEEIQPHNLRRDAFWGMKCAMGADLSQGDDFCAFTFIFPLDDGGFGVKTRSYITSLTRDRLPGALHKKYDEFIMEGSLIVFDGITLDMMDVYDDLEAHIIKQKYEVRAFGFDPYNAKEFVDRYVQENSGLGVEKVAQGARTESVPLGELKIYAEQRKLMFDEGLMTYTMGNAIIEVDTNKNKKLSKTRREEKIDNVAAMMDAYIAWKSNKELF